MITGYVVLSVALTLTVIYFSMEVDALKDRLRDQHELIGRIIKIADQQTDINAAQRGFNISSMDLLKAQAEAIDTNTVRIETLAKSDLSL